MPPKERTTNASPSDQTDDGGAATSADATAFVAELHDAFARLAPQGSLAWAYQSAYDDLARQFGIDGEPSGHLDESAPHNPSSGVGRRALEHVAPRLESWIDARISAAAATATQRALADGLGQIEAGLASASEALRFLAARVAELEADAQRRRVPVDDLAELFEPFDVTAWTDATVQWITTDPLGGEVVHAECGDGELLTALAEAGMDAYGIDPRGSCALATLRRHQRVHLADTATYVRTLVPASMAGIVLSSVIDRLAVEDLVDLVGLCVSKLRAGAAVVVIGAGDDAEGRLSPSARDLAPGRGLRAETWERLLRRAGCTDVHGLRSGGPGAEPAGGADAELGFAVAARWPG